MKCESFFSEIHCSLTSDTNRIDSDMTIKLGNDFQPRLVKRVPSYSAVVHTSHKIHKDHFKSLGWKLT